jgi:pimeloyl-ACP methyl ester carboxylesterase
LLYGTQSTIDPSWRAAGDAGVRLVPVAGAGHDMMHEAPDAFVATLARAIGALDFVAARPAPRPQARPAASPGARSG